MNRSLSTEDPVAQQSSGSSEKGSLYIDTADRHPQRASQVVLAAKNPHANAGDARDMGSIPGLGRCPGKRNSNPLQYS